MHMRSPPQSLDRLLDRWMNTETNPVEVHAHLLDLLDANDDDGDDDDVEKITMH